MVPYAKIEIFYASNARKAFSVAVPLEKSGVVEVPVDKFLFCEPTFKRRWFLVRNSSRSLISYKINKKPSLTTLVK